VLRHPALDSLGIQHLVKTLTSTPERRQRSRFAFHRTTSWPHGCGRCARGLHETIDHSVHCPDQATGQPLARRPPCSRASRSATTSPCSTVRRPAT
jgi:hypothetical protein